MNRKIVILNLALLALVGSLGWLIRSKWKESNAHAAATLAQPAKPAPVIAPPAPVPPGPIAPGDYLEVAQRDLYAKDRNPIPVVDPPKPPPPPPPMPALPTYYGQMTLGDPVVLLTPPGSTQQKSYAVGDKIGDFKVLAFNQEVITFEWNGNKVERKIAELAPKQATPQADAAPAAAAPAAGGQVTSLSGPATKNGEPEAATKPPTLGTDMGGGFRACVAGDTSPAGTTLNGYKKVITRSLMGQSCYWEQSK